MLGPAIWYYTTISGQVQIDRISRTPRTMMFNTLTTKSQIKREVSKSNCVRKAHLLFVCELYDSDKKIKSNSAHSCYLYDYTYVLYLSSL